jgi:hypothetical protein
MRRSLSSSSGDRPFAGPPSATRGIGSEEGAVKRHCADDVALERDLTDFVDRYGYVLNQIGRTGGPQCLQVPAWKPGN